MKTAILQVADTGPLESLVIMLRAVGYQCYLPGAGLRNELRNIGCRLVLEITDLVNTWGYDRPLSLPEAGPGLMDSCDLYVDVKAHQCYGKIVRRWPNLKNRVLWYRINGGKPEHVINKHGDHGDEMNPPCPVLTPNQWYACGHEDPDHTGQCIKCQSTEMATPSVPGAYCCWPPFYRQDEYYGRYGRKKADFTGPVCFIHNFSGWGYGALAGEMKRLGVALHGLGSPDGLIRHRDVPGVLSRTLCMVHLKSSDAPGYALYEALAAACPVVCTRRLIWRCRMQELLTPGETCLVFDRETHEGLTPDDVETCAAEVYRHLEALRDPQTNRRIGLAGRERLLEVMWSESRREDVESLLAFLGRHFS